MLYSESGARFGCNKGSKDDTDAWWVLEHKPLYQGYMNRKQLVPNILSVHRDFLKMMVLMFFHGHINASGHILQYGHQTLRHQNSSLRVQ